MTKNLSQGRLATLLSAVMLVVAHLAQAVQFMGVGDNIGIEQLDNWNWRHVVDDDEHVWVVTFCDEKCPNC